MTTRIVGGSIVTPDGVPLGSVPIEIELLLADAFVVTGSYSMGGRLRVQSAANGSWQTPLECNDDLTPVGTIYQVTEKIPAQFGGTKRYLIQVLTGLGGGINLVANLVVPAAVPVGGTYQAIASGPTGLQGVPGTPGFVVVADPAAALAISPKVKGQLVYVDSLSCLLYWNGGEFRIISPGSIPTGTSTFFAGTTSGTTLLTIGTFTIAAIEFRRTIMISGILHATLSVPTDVFEFSVTDGTNILKSKVRASDVPIPLPPFGGNVVIATTAMTIDFKLQRLSGTGTATPTETGGTYSRGEYRLRPM